MSVSRALFWGLVSAVAVMLAGCRASADSCADSHYGDLVLQGNDMLVIDGTTYCQTGDVHVSENARLVIRNGTLAFNQRYHGEYRLYFSGSARLEITAGAIESPYAYGLMFYDQSCGLVDGGRIGAAQFGLTQESSLSLSDSEVLNIQLWGAARLDVNGSSINEVALWAEGSARAEIVNLQPGYFSQWGLHADNTVEDWGVDITLTDSDVRNWGFAASGSSVMTFDNCRFGLDLRENADATVMNSDLVVVGLVFEAGQTIVLRELRRGFLTQWDIEHGVVGYAGGPRLEIDNCELERFWNIWNTGADLAVVGCELGYLWLAGSIGPVTTVEGSTIDSLVFAEHHGTVRFSNTIVSWRFFPPFNGATRIEGDVRFLMDHLTFEEGDWHNATIVREFPVVVVDASGFPLAGVALQLHSPSGGVVWSGESDAEGRADFEITFGDANSEDTWTLTAPSIEATKEVTLLTESPVRVSEGGSDLNGDGVTNVLDVRLVLQAALGLIQLTDEQVSMADVDGDGQVSMLDAQILAARIVGIEQ